MKTDKCYYHQRFLKTVLYNGQDLRIPTMTPESRPILGKGSPVNKEVKMTLRYDLTKFLYIYNKICQHIKIEEVLIDMGKKCKFSFCSFEHIDF